MKILNYLIVFIFALWLVTPASAQLPTASQLANQMTIGWNIGNSLEVPDGETAWGNPMVNQQLINAVKAAGFNTIRIPCAWNSYADQSTYQIQSSWLARVKEVVDYAYSIDMFVILNSHWDNGWLEENPYYWAQAEVNAKQEAYWTQIANYFQSYDEHLLFAGTNEVRHGYDDPSAENVEVQQSYNQTFVDAVRATGGNNSSRTLIVQTYNTNIWLGFTYFTLPNDSISGRLMVEVHHYDPYDFTINTNNTCIYWGSPFPEQSACSWAQESYIDDLFSQVGSTWPNNGIPVVMGEYGAMYRTDLGDPDALASREYWLEYNTAAAVNNGVIPVYWDNGYSGNNGMALFDRNTGAIVDQGGLDALLSGAGGTTTTTSATTSTTTTAATTSTTTTAATTSTTTTSGGSCDCGTCDWYGTDVPTCCESCSGWGWYDGGCRRSCVCPGSCPGGDTTTTTASSTSTTTTAATTSTTTTAATTSTTTTAATTSTTTTAATTSTTTTASSTSTTTTSGGSCDCGTCSWWGTPVPMCCIDVGGWGWQDGGCNRSCVSESICPNN